MAESRTKQEILKMSLKHLVVKERKSQITPKKYTILKYVKGTKESTDGVPNSKSRSNLSKNKERNKVVLGYNTKNKVNI